MKKLIFMFVVLFTIGFTVSVLADVAQGKPIWETNSDKVCGDKLCSEVESVPENNNSITQYLPPLRQIDSGVLPSDVTCIEGFSLIFKPNDMSACVRDSTAERLTLRGWSMSLINSFEDCAADGNPVMESYPRQCATKDGKHFVEELPIAIDYMITEVIDGDTVKVNGESVRFALASAPELSEAGGVEARDFILNLCPLGTFVSVDEDAEQPDGSYGRMLAVVYCNGVNLNSELLDSGLGTLSTEFCPESEFAGKDWALKHGCGAKPPVAPIQANCDAAYPTICLESGIADLDCGEITHRNFKVLPPDPHRFDADKDGIGCEI